MTIPKFLITLDRQIQRNQEFALNNPELTNLQIFQSYDGQKLDFLDDWARPKVAENLNWVPGAIGCGLAHMKLWEKCVELDTPILILENDAKLVTDFDIHLERLARTLPDDWDIILFGSNWDSFTFIDIFNEVYGTAKVEFNQFLLGVFFESTNFNFSEPTFYKVRVTYGTHCYLISPKGARELEMGQRLRDTAKSMKGSADREMTDQIRRESRGVKDDSLRGKFSELTGMKKGGMTASSRADGCCVKGKTKGKMY
jgi:GR25 family glycosyltransferase involved in LPS biosynthesis